VGEVAGCEIRKTYLSTEALAQEDESTKRIPPLYERGVRPQDSKREI